MEENQTSTSTQKESGTSKKWVIIVVVGIIVILVAAGGGFLFLNSKEGNPAEEMMEVNEESGAQATPVPTSQPESVVPKNYKDGTYTATGTYAYHAGTEDIGVTVTLSNGVIKNVSVEEMAKNPMSKKMQDDFAANYKPEVIGKNIDEIKLSKVSGSSLTPIGFNAALDDIRKQASQS